VYPHRLCDGGAVVLRARLALNLAPLLWPGRPGVDAGGLLTRELTVDLSEPPQRAKYRERVVALRAEGETERAIAARLGITQPAVQNAAALQRRMDRDGRADP